MEFKLINPKEESGFIQAIEFNFEELKSELERRLEKYNNLVYSEESIKDAKDDRAGLNKFKEAIETRRKEIKNLCLKPYNDFEKKVKELTNLIDSPISAIDAQIRNFENQRIESKKSEIIDFYKSVIENYSDIIPLEKIFNSKWLNATYKINAIQKEIVETIGAIKGNLKIISDFKLENDLELQVKNKYLETLDFSLAMAEKTRLENLKTSLKKVEVEKIDETQIVMPLNSSERGEIENETEKINEEFFPTVSTDTEGKEEEPLEIIQSGEITYTRKFWVKGSAKQLRNLGQYLKENNIEYGGIE
ncbi:MAG: DUF1351 domain-containing protein [Candidatus Gastranaerophilales bacterium]|nr:DUF1351 domain-containing protein [Candidatus Gastranaerophilales bacterium]